MSTANPLLEVSSRATTTNLTTQDWYQALVEECDAIITETIFNSRWELIKGYHALGKRILEEQGNFERYKIYGKDIVQDIAKSTGKSKRTIYYAIAFATKFPDVNTLPEGKNISWYKVCTKLLPESRKGEPHCEHEEVIEVKVCKTCNHQMDEVAHVTRC